MPDRLIDSLRRWWAGQRTPSVTLQCPHSPDDVLVATALTTPVEYCVLDRERVVAAYPCRHCSREHAYLWTGAEARHVGDGSPAALDADALRVEA
ncbi:hypothetical protein [Halomarina oriensis]|uniref:Uncharacterized protein n=1 Tax=Halomarina oriensis TaxID=671145 RepID=A0A6B0GXJ6_9EURY|nr:hypothetical protein [Halomarina oriensis]MWG36498.1 hypothetical protein [Halomarina oriensis]